jgi:uncharacterized damage-inducible protein DinB
MIQMEWTQRTFSFDFPLGVFPGIVERLRGTPARIGELLRGLPHNMLIRRSSNRWSINEHIGHLIDLDDLYHQRLSEFIKGAPELSAADMTNQRTHEANYNDVVTGTLLDYFRARRADLVQRLESLSEEQVAHTALHPRLQRPMRLVDWTYFVAEHDDHHLARIRELI